MSTSGGRLLVSRDDYDPVNAKLTAVFRWLVECVRQGLLGSKAEVGSLSWLSDIAEKESSQLETAWRSADPQLRDSYLSSGMLYVFACSAILKECPPTVRWYLTSRSCCPESTNALVLRWLKNRLHGPQKVTASDLAATPLKNVSHLAVGDTLMDFLVREEVIPESVSRYCRSCFGCEMQCPLDAEDSLIAWLQCAAEEEKSIDIQEAISDGKMLWKVLSVYNVSMKGMKSADVKSVQRTVDVVSQCLFTCYRIGVPCFIEVEDIIYGAPPLRVPITLFLAGVYRVLTKKYSPTSGKVLSEKRRQMIADNVVAKDKEGNAVVERKASESQGKSQTDSEESSEPPLGSPGGNRLEQQKSKLSELEAQIEEYYSNRAGGRHGYVVGRKSSDLDEEEESLENKSDLLDASVQTDELSEFEDVEEDEVMEDSEEDKNEREDGDFVHESSEQENEESPTEASTNVEQDEVDEGSSDIQPSNSVEEEHEIFGAEDEVMIQDESLVEERENNKEIVRNDEDDEREGGRPEYLDEESVFHDSEEFVVDESCENEDDWNDGNVGENVSSEGPKDEIDEIERLRRENLSLKKKLEDQSKKENDVDPKRKSEIDEKSFFNEGTSGNEPSEFIQSEIVVEDDMKDEVMMEDSESEIMETDSTNEDVEVGESAAVSDTTEQRRDSTEDNLSLEEEKATPSSKSEKKEDSDVHQKAFTMTIPVEYFNDADATEVTPSEATPEDTNDHLGGVEWSLASSESKTPDVERQRKRERYLDVQKRLFEKAEERRVSAEARRRTYGSRGPAQRDMRITQSVVPSSEPRHRKRVVREQTDTAEQLSSSPVYKHMKHPLVGRSNKKIVKNALQRVCLAGMVNRKEMLRVVDILEKHPDGLFVLLIRSPEQPVYRALYLYSPDTGRTIRIDGNGPRFLEDEMVGYFLKFDSGAKCFRRIGTKELCLTTDAVCLSSSFLRKTRKDKEKKMYIV